MKNIVLAIIAFFSFHPIGLAQTFQNNDLSCEDIPVIGSLRPGPQTLSLISTSIACGNFNDDDFVDCGLQRDGIPEFVMNPAPSNNLLNNTGVHGSNCANLGESSQFSATTLTNTTLISTVPIRMSTLSVGNLDNQNFDDLAFGYVFDFNLSPESRAIQFQFSQVGGGFPEPDFTPSSAQLPGIGGFRAMGFPSQPFNFFPIWPSGNQGAERSLLLEDCDGNSVDEAILAVRRLDMDPMINDELGFIISRNNNDGMGLQDLVFMDFHPIPVNLANPHNSLASVTLSAGDFDGDGIIDVAAAANADLAGGDKVVLCRGDGMCGFSCSANDIFDFVDQFPTSIVSGDFDGNGELDLAVSQAASSSVRYLLNPGNGAPLVNWIETSKALGGVNTARPLVIDAGKFSTLAITKATDEVVVSSPRYNAGAVDFSAAQFTSTLEFIPTDGLGGLGAVETLQFSPSDSNSASGIAVADFDHCGGDDLIALSQTNGMNNAIDRRASLFLNFNEVPQVSANAPSEIDINVALPIVATCSDPTGDDRTFQWEVLSAPANAQVIFSVPNGPLVNPATDASTSFQADVAGNYEIKLSCQDFCAASAEVLLQILVKDVPPPDTTTTTSTSTTGEDSTTTAGFTDTQGGCMASLGAPRHAYSLLNSGFSLLTGMAILGLARMRRGRCLRKPIQK